MKKKHSHAIVWLRRDLRLKDNKALEFALKNSDQVIILYNYSPNEESHLGIGSASKWWLHHSLISLEKQIKDKGGQLVIREGESKKILLQIIEENKVSLVTWNRLYDPLIIERDKDIKQSLKKLNIEVESFSGATLLEPWELKTTTGGPYQVFSPFWRALQKNYTNIKPIPTPKNIPTLNNKIKSIEIDKLNLLPKIKWDKEFYNHWNPGEEGAQRIVSDFIKLKIKNYKKDRDFPALPANSTLSPHLHFGEISPNDIWFQCVENKNLIKEDIEPFIRQLGWRDFANHLLFHFPKTVEHPLKNKFNNFPWQNNKKLLKAWQSGQTGYPIVDAGMRELWRTGIMHNRVRMIVGSILVKNFLIHWHKGADWFWDCLIDADLANNTLGWQWIAGCGADAAPYFRIFNPVSQSEKFDAEGIYLRTWVPELKKLPNKWIHKPWEAPQDTLDNAGIKIGKNYPRPIIDLKESREEALEAYYNLKN